jgi:hypothetical protein
LEVNCRVQAVPRAPREKISGELDEAAFIAAMLAGKVVERDYAAQRLSFGIEPHRVCGWIVSGYRHWTDGGIPCGCGIESRPYEAVHRNGRPKWTAEDAARRAWRMYSVGDAVGPYSQVEP